MLTAAEVMEAQYGLYTWPSAEMLARHLWHERAALRLDGARGLARRPATDDTRQAGA